jgi:NADPH-dependent ferric siderophore reductase
MTPSPDTAPTAGALPTVLEVADVIDLTASMRRIRFAGAGVAAYLCAPRIPNIKLFLPGPEGLRDLPTPDQADHHRVTAAQRARVRTYTVRAYDTEAATLDIDFVRHGDEGLASAWAERARPGDKLGALGGGGRLPAPSPWLALVADDTGVPGALAILEQLPAGQRGIALLEVDGAEHEQPVAAPRGVEVRWLHRRGARPGASDVLLEAALGLALPDPLEEDFIWVSAESRVVRAVRRHVRMLGVPRGNQLIIGYWRRGITETAYGTQSRNDRVPGESLVVLPENGKLRADSLGRLLAGDAESHLAESDD